MKSILAIMQHRTSARIIEDDDAPIRPFPNVYAFPSERYSFPWRRLLWPSPQNGSYLLFLLVEYPLVLYLSFFIYKKNHIYDFPTPIPIIILHLSQLFALFPFPIPFNQPITTRITSNRGTNTVSRISSRTLCSRTSSPIS